MSAELVIRQAREDDLPAIVRLLADDELGRERERAEEPLPECYIAAFQEIARDPAQELMVVEGSGVVATAQLSFLQYLTHKGGRRAGGGSAGAGGVARLWGGPALFEHMIARARGRGCWVVQVTTDKHRPDALRFYEPLGFEATHEGMKLHLAREQG